MLRLMHIRCSRKGTQVKISLRSQAYAFEYKAVRGHRCMDQRLIYLHDRDTDIKGNGRPQTRQSIHSQEWSNVCFHTTAYSNDRDSRHKHHARALGSKYVEVLDAFNFGFNSVSQTRGARSPSTCKSGACQHRRYRDTQVLADLEFSPQLDVINSRNPL